MADAAAWSASAEATQTSREQLAYLLEQPDIVVKLNERFGNLQLPQRQGHVFEWMHELTFNLDAIAHDDGARARVTTWLGEPHAPADLRVLGPDGQLLSEVQAKVVADPVHRLGAEHGLSSPKYDGMERLVPTDHVEPALGLIDRRLEMPEGPLHARYADVRDHLTDTVEHGDVSSTPVNTETLAEAAKDPSRFLDDHVEHARFDGLLAGTGAAGATAAVTAAIAAAAVSAARAGSAAGIPWTRIGCLAAQAGARGCVIGLGGEAISQSAQEAAADGAAGAVEALIGGTLPFALARGTWAIAAAAHGWATGRLDAAEAAAVAAESVAQTGAVWACAAIGQTLIPVPVLGAMVGAVVGRHGATMMAQGIRLAVAARDMDAAWDAQYAALLEETAALEELSRAEQARLAVLAAEYRTVFTETVLPALERIDTSADPDVVLDALAEVTVAYAGTPMFRSMEQFETFMADPTQTLVLSFGGARTRSITAVGHER